MPRIGHADLAAASVLAFGSRLSRRPALVAVRLCDAVRMPWRDWSDDRRSIAVSTVMAAFLLVSAVATWAQGARWMAALFAVAAPLNVLGTMWLARRDHRASAAESEPAPASGNGPVWRTNTAAAVSALTYALSIPLVVAVGVGLSITGLSWGFPVGVLGGILLLRLSQGSVNEYGEATGAKVTEWAMLSPGYLRFYAVPLGLDWRVAAAVCWVAPVALASFWVFLVLHAAVDFLP